MEKHILFVEDDTTIASGLRYAMEQEGYRVMHCKSARAAHERARDTQFDLVLLDMQLPDGERKRDRPVDGSFADSGYLSDRRGR